MHQLLFIVQLIYYHLEFDTLFTSIFVYQVILSYFQDLDSETSSIASEESNESDCAPPAKKRKSLRCGVCQRFGHDAIQTQNFKDCFKISKVH